MSLPAYCDYTDSGVDWLGEFPEHWSVTAIKHVCREITDGAHVSPETENGVQCFVSTKDVLDNAIDFDNCLRTSDASYEYLLKTGCKPFVGDVLFSKDGTIGRTVVVGEGREFVVASSLIIIRPLPERLDSGFLHHLCQSTLVQNQVERFVRGAGLPRLSITNLTKVVGCFPPLDEQKAISSFLDLETSKIDGLVSEQLRLIELLKEKRQAVISHAVTKGLNPNAPMKPSGIQCLGDLPQHWTMKRLKHVSPFISVGIVVNPTTYVSEDQNDLPFIYGGDIREGVIDWANSRRIHRDASGTQEKTRLEEGDLLVVRVGAPGVTAVVPIECEGGNCASVMLMRKGEFNSHWLCYAMNTRIVRFQVEIVEYGAAQKQFNIAHAVNFWVPVPDRSEQNKIAAYLDKRIGEFIQLQAEAERAIELLQERRTALISAAVTGKIDVREFAYQETT
ncbi:MAG: restriction endonuclease subunit S [Rhodopirellula sp.]|nr:restriction endonuclease subunit S [Rhodopirellula sp.]